MEVPGKDHFVSDLETQDVIADASEEFITGERHRAEPDRMLATLMFTDIGEDPMEALVGVGRYIICAGGPDRHRADVAFTVLDEHQGKGIGSLLLRHLAIIGRAQGLREFQAEVLADNSKMLALFDGSSGFRFLSVEGSSAIVSSTRSTPKSVERCIGLRRACFIWRETAWSINF